MGISFKFHISFIITSSALRFFAFMQQFTLIISCNSGEIEKQFGRNSSANSAVLVSKIACFAIRLVCQCRGIRVSIGRKKHLMACASRRAG